MKKKVIILTFVMALVLLIVVAGLTLFNNKIASKITIDINPSFEINLNKDEEVISIIALNDDAKNIVNDNLKGKNIEETLNVITDGIIKNGYASEEELLEIILNVDGNISDKQLEEKITKTFREKNIDAKVTIVDKITSEDKKIAKTYNISPAKASFIKSIIDENKNISIDALSNKSVSELIETKETGNFCDRGYTLQGDWCYKEIDRKPASSGEVCPRGYWDYDGKCFKEGMVIDTGKIHCRDGYELKGEDCIRNEIRDAVPTGFDCAGKMLARKSEIGFFIDNGKDDYICYTTDGAKKPTLRCLLNKGHKMINGECYNGPAPLINGGCPGADIAVGGWCYSKDDGDQWECPNGNIYEKSKGNVPEYCPDTIKYSVATPSGYKCEDDGDLKGELQDKKCIYTFYEPPVREHSCEDGYTKVIGDTCLDMKDIKSKQDGFFCEDENAKLKGNECIIYNMIEAKHN